jgi:exonuclease SbcD
MNYNGTIPDGRHKPVKIALTADLHLTTPAENPERFQTLAAILQECGRKKIQLLIIAGDLFDQDRTSYMDFERAYREHRPQNLRTIIIPGNHDLNLKPGHLACEGLVVYAEPVLQPLNEDGKILFLPYQPQHTMGEAIALFADQLQAERWILVSHGDWTAGTKAPDPYEKGTYMPLTRVDLQTYHPELVFLGHIHLPQSDGQVWYPGSPCPINPGETGLRRFLILDTSSGEVSSETIDSPLVYFRERFVMLPLENGLELLENEIAASIKDWNLPAGWENRLQLLIEVCGTSLSPRVEVQQKVRSAYKGFSFYQDKDPDLDQLTYNPDPDRAEIARRFALWLDDLEWETGSRRPTRSQILEAGLRIIYGVR